MALFSCGGLSFWLSAVILQAACVLHVSAAPRRFSISNDLFMKDNEPFIIRSGSLHYFRVPAQYWRDRIQRMKALGLNTVTAYVAWNYHEEVEGQFHDLEMVSTFLDIIHEEGMLVILRPGPYICAEWEFGGLPSYLLGKTGIKIRTYNAPYINAVDRWLNKLYTSIGSKAYSKGGPIIAVQIENEYGSFANVVNNSDDAKYMHHLYDLAYSYFGPDMLYTTIDGGEDGDETKKVLEQGSPWKNNASVFGTIDGGLMSNYSKKFAQQKEFNAPGNCPKMWCELWVGWFTVWGDENQANYSAFLSDGPDHISVKDGIKEIVDEGASFSIYMAHGGTNFGFWAGANGDEKKNDWRSIEPDITSYDYSSPISEAGDHNIGSDGGDLFAAVQEAISSKYGKAPDEPAPIPKAAYGEIALTESADLFGSLEKLQSCSHTVEANEPFPTFEDLGHAYGFMLYSRTPGSSFSGQTLNFNSHIVHDRVQVFVDSSPIGIAYRRQGDSKVSTPGGKSMDLLVENMGRINYGQAMYDYKGLVNMTPPVEGSWTAYCLPLKSATVQGLTFSADPKWTLGQPMFRRGTLNVIGAPKDTFLDVGGLTKGLIWVNGNNLGRYWATQGPQCTLYVPASFLSSGANEVIVLDLEGSTTNAIVSVAAPRFSVCTARKVGVRLAYVVIAGAVIVVLLIAGCICCYCYCRKKASARISPYNEGTHSGFGKLLLEEKLTAAT